MDPRGARHGQLLLLLLTMGSFQEELSRRRPQGSLQIQADAPLQGRMQGNPCLWIMPWRQSLWPHATKKAPRPHCHPLQILRRATPLDSRKDRKIQTGPQIEASSRERPTQTPTLLRVHSIRRPKSLCLSHSPPLPEPAKKHPGLHLLHPNRGLSRVPPRGPRTEAGVDAQSRLVARPTRPTSL